jgi:glycosyltransferase involved in cell wall biosynthesis
VSRGSAGAPGAALRLLIITDSYPPFVGGADRQIEMIARDMARRGHTVEVVTPWQPGLAFVERSEERLVVRRVRPLLTRIPWFYRDPGRRHHPPFPDPGTTVAIRRIVRRLRPDVVHTYGWISYSAALALVGSRVPLLLSSRDHGYVCAVRHLVQFGRNDCSGPGPVKCLMCASRTYLADELGVVAVTPTASQRIRAVGKAVVAVVAIRAGAPLIRASVTRLHVASGYVRDACERWLIRGRAIPIDIIPSFLAEDAPSTIEGDVLSRLPAEPFILFVGRIEPQKGIATLISAWSALARRPPLVLVGPRSHLSPQTFPEGVHVLPSVTHATVLALWDRASIGVVPSLGGETFGNVAVEAMSRGRAIVASATGGLVDIVEDDRNGLLVPPGDITALRDAMARLLANDQLRDRLGAAARERADQFRAGVILPRFEALYRAAADRGAAAKSA